MRVTLTYLYRDEQTGTIPTARESGLKKKKSSQRRENTVKQLQAYRNGRTQTLQVHAPYHVTLSRWKCLNIMAYKNNQLNEILINPEPLIYTSARRSVQENKKTAFDYDNTS